jgi:DNA polymerase elongation subunit (family B)
VNGDAWLSVPVIPTLYRPVALPRSATGADESMSQEYRGEFHVYKECSEHPLLEMFVLEVRLAAPRVFVTYNGDYVYWPFVENLFTTCQACN